MTLRPLYRQGTPEAIAEAVREQLSPAFGGRFLPEISFVLSSYRKNPRFFHKIYLLTSLAQKGKEQL